VVATEAVDSKMDSQDSDKAGTERNHRGPRHYRFGRGVEVRVLAGIGLLTVGLVSGGIYRINGCGGTCKTSGHILQGFGIVAAGVIVIGLTWFALRKVRGRSP